MNKPVFPDYTNSILNLSSSILKHFGIESGQKTLKEVDDILSKNPQHVVVILLDGMGMNILRKHLKKTDFFRTNLLKEYSSVFPPTTTASTTTFLSCKSPIEHGWLGWDVYFEQEKKCVTCFFNTLQGTHEPAAEYNIPYKYLSFENIITKINKKGSGKADLIYPFGPNPFRKLDDWISEIKRQCNQKEKTFTYAYWENPDGTLHKEGTESKNVHSIMLELNSKIEELCAELKDTVVFITADHGHIDMKTEFIAEDYKDLAEMLEIPVCIEPRAASFYVKEKYKKDFPDLFNKYFGEKFVLFTKEEVFEKQIFGTGKPNENLTGIGDFVAAAVGDRILAWSRDNYPIFKSHHAGMTVEEIEIPLICIQK